MQSTPKLTISKVMHLIQSYADRIRCKPLKTIVYILKIIVIQDIETVSTEREETPL
jgi:hypothetical protein